MVEPQPDSYSRASTPLAPSLSRPYSNHNGSTGPLEPLATNRASPESSSETETVTDGDKHPLDSMPDDARNRPTHASRRRPSYTGGASRQSAGPPPSTHPTFISPDASLRHPAFHYSSPPFPQQASYYGQYTVPSQPPPLPAPLYPFTHSPHSHDTPLGQPQHPFPQQLHQSPSPYQFPPRHAPEGPSRPPAFSRTPSHHRSPLSGAIDGNVANGHPYLNSPPPFQPMVYSPQLSSPQYSYPTHYSTPPAAYQPFGAIHYPPHVSSPDMDSQTPQGSWYFVPHNQQHQFDNGPFQSGYQSPYQPLGQHQDLSAHVSLTSVTTPLHQQRPFEIQNHTASPTLPPSIAQPSGADGASSTSASSPQLSPQTKPVIRREYHPKPPPHRSPWVMWVGNVPSDASQEELWKFFTQIPGPSGTTDDSGVESIHLISRSNCAFINYSSEAAVTCAISSVNGLRLRPNDPQCPMLVCKIRRSMDDLQSGVGGQRGIGLHKQWVRDQRNKMPPDTLVEGKDGPNHLANTLASVSLSPSERSRRGTHTSSSSSHASTSSSFLVEFFPTRYFILKSLSEDDVNLSVENGLWATQKHNELLLDQAFRTARDVFLIFSVNKSGEFYGYAKMIGPIRQGEGSVNWVMRGPESPSQPIFRAKSTCGVPTSPHPPIYFTPDEGHLVDVSPQGLEGSTTPLPHFNHAHRSAPPKFGGPPTAENSIPPSLRFSLDRFERAQRKADRFSLDPEAPSRAMRTPPSPGEAESMGKEGLKLPVANNAALDDYQEQAEKRPSEAQWGECFKVEWLERRKIPFHRTRHLRNPWNKSREIKISRDGTELESSVGAKLLEEWGTLAETDTLRSDKSNPSQAS